MGRLSWDEYFMKIAHLVSERSTCLSSQYGAVIVKDKQMLSSGYNGSPKSTPHCIDVGCLRENSEHGDNYKNCRATHAEQNAIAQAAYNGHAIKESTIYVTGSPCPTCAKLMINAGIERVVYVDDHIFELSDELLSEAEIEVDIYE